MSTEQDKTECLKISKNGAEFEILVDAHVMECFRSVKPKAVITLGGSRFPNAYARFSDAYTGQT